MEPGAPVLSPHALISSKDREDVLRLFAGVLAEAETAGKEAGCRSVMLPGPFWLLARRQPSRADLRAYFNGELPSGWPAWFARNRKGIDRDPLWTAFGRCVEACIENAAWPEEQGAVDACRIMAAVSQTLYSTNPAIVTRNRALTRNFPEPEPEPEPQKAVDEGIDDDADLWTGESGFLANRPDERGGSVAARGMNLWMASHVGPAFADKMENQDAVYAAASGEIIVFALADGVSTSLGSRFAAALAVHHFCAELQLLLDGASPESPMLIEAARRTQRELDQALDRLLCDPSSPEMDAIRGPEVKPSLASSLLRNTQTAEKSFLQPALATTLIGGVLERLPSGGARCMVLVLGDGAVERITTDGTVIQVLETDPEVMAIEASLGAGPHARETLESGPVPVSEIDLRPGEHLLVSSDGLTRGHQGSVCQVTTSLLGDFLPRLHSASRSAALQLLRDLVASAEKKHPDPTLFDDNLSLIVVGIDP